MKKKKADRVSVREAIKLNIRAIKTVYGGRRKLFLLQMSKTAFAALTPYVEIYLSALLIDELTTTRSAERLTSLVLWIIGSAAVITLVQAILNRLHAVESSQMWEHIHHLFGKKMLSMDFVAIDSPSTHTLASKIRQNTNGGGWGLDRIVWQLDNVWSFPEVFDTIRKEDIEAFLRQRAHRHVVHEQGRERLGGRVPQLTVRDGRCYHSDGRDNIRVTASLCGRRPNIRTSVGAPYADKQIVRLLRLVWHP